MSAPPRAHDLGWKSRRSLFELETICSPKGVTLGNARTKKKVTTEFLRIPHVASSDTLLVYINNQIQLNGYYVYSDIGKCIISIKNA